MSKDTHITPDTEESESEDITINKSSQSLEERMFWDQQEELDPEEEKEEESSDQE